MQYYWMDERHQLTYRKCVSHAVEMVDGCSKENGVLCTVARSWLLFLHDESEWKNFESNIAWGVDELHQTFWFEQFFNGKLCCKIHDLLSGWGYCSALSLDKCLIKINYGRFFVAPRKLCRLAWHRVWLICNAKRCFHWTTIFLRKMAECSLWWFGCSQFHGRHCGVLLDQVFQC